MYTYIYIHIYVNVCMSMCAYLCIYMYVYNDNNIYSKDKNNNIVNKQTKIILKETNFRLIHLSVTTLQQILKYW